MRIASFLLSLMLHMGILLLALFWPESSPIRLDRPLYQVTLVSLGEPGGSPLPPASTLPAMPPSATKGAAKPIPTAQDANKPAIPASKNNVETPIEQKKTIESKPEPALPDSQLPKKPISQETTQKIAKEIKKVAPETKPKPEPQKAPQDKAQAISTKKKPAKPAPEKKSTPKQDASKKTEPKTKVPTPKKQPKPAPSSDDILKRALADARGQAQKQASNKAKQESSSVADALAAMQNLSSSSPSSSGTAGNGQGSGTGGAGIGDVYISQVMALVRYYWEFPQLATRQNLQARVRVYVDSSGRIADVTLEQSSGRPDFDASAMKALAKAQTLPPPPREDFKDLVLVFNLQELLQ